jgi:hypothetical protein
MDFLPSPVFAGGPSLGGLRKLPRSDSWSLTPSATLFAPETNSSSRSLSRLSHKRCPSAPRSESSLFSTVKTADVAATLLKLNASYHNWSKQLTSRSKKGVVLTSSATTPLIKVLSLNMAFVNESSRVQRQAGSALLGSRASRLRQLNTAYIRTAMSVAASTTQEVALTGSGPQVLPSLHQLNAAYTRSTGPIHSSPSCKLLGSRLSQLRALNQAYVDYAQQDVAVDGVLLASAQCPKTGGLVAL